MSDCSTETTKAELLPCPFCGGEAEQWSHNSKGNIGMIYSVSCNQCEVFNGPYGTKQKAIDAWNKRASFEHEAAL